MEKPLSLLKLEYGKTPELEQWLQREVIDKQEGKAHPQSSDPGMRLYKVFDCNREISCLTPNYTMYPCCLACAGVLCMTNHCPPGAKASQIFVAIKGKKKVPRNKAVRQSVLEAVRDKCADMKDPDKSGPGKKTPKKKEEKALAYLAMIPLHSRPSLQTLVS